MYLNCIRSLVSSREKLSSPYKDTGGWFPEYRTNHVIIAMLHNFGQEQFVRSIPVSVLDFLFLLLVFYLFVFVDPGKFLNSFRCFLYMTN